MARLWWVSLVVLAMCLPAQAVGNADGARAVGLPEWAMARRAEMLEASPQEGAVGQALGGAVGLSAEIRERLMNRESLGAGVGLSEELRTRLMEQGALGTSSGAPAAIQESLMNRLTLGAAVGMPQAIRDRLMGIVPAPEATPEPTPEPTAE
jgi:hypothetical protein